MGIDRPSCGQAHDQPAGRRPASGHGSRLLGELGAEGAGGVDRERCAGWGLAMDRRRMEQDALFPARPAGRCSTGGASSPAGRRTKGNCRWCLRRRAIRARSRRGIRSRIWWYRCSAPLLHGPGAEIRAVRARPDTAPGSTTGGPRSPVRPHRRIEGEVYLKEMLSAPRDTDSLCSIRYRTSCHCVRHVWFCRSGQQLAGLQGAY